MQNADTIYAAIIENTSRFSSLTNYIFNIYHVPAIVIPH